MLFSFSLFHKTTLGISLGSSNTYIARHGKGIVLGEPSVVATDIYNEKVVAIGDKAKKMIGRAPETISVDRPIRAALSPILTRRSQCFVSMSPALCRQE